MQTFYKKALFYAGHKCLHVCKGKISMSASKTKCRHADIKIYNFTIVIIHLSINNIFYIQ